MHLIDPTDPLIARRLKLKLETFLSDHRRQDRSALVLQAMPASPTIELDVLDPSVRTAFVSGIELGDGREWDGFRGHTSALRGSVDGIVSDKSIDRWASELHIDGHLIAGAWAFESEIPVITWDYADLFADFGELAARLAPSISSGPWLLTADFVGAGKVSYGSKAGRSSNRVSKPTRRSDLRFRIRLCNQPSSLSGAAALLAKDFKREYGEP